MKFPTRHLLALLLLLATGPLHSRAESPAGESIGDAAKRFVSYVRDQDKWDTAKGRLIKTAGTEKTYEGDEFPGALSVSFLERPPEGVAVLGGYNRLISIRFKKYERPEDVTTDYNQLQAAFDEVLGAEYIRAGKGDRGARGQLAKEQAALDRYFYTKWLTKPMTTTPDGNSTEHSGYVSMHLQKDREGSFIFVINIDDGKTVRRPYRPSDFPPLIPQGR